MNDTPYLMHKIVTHRFRQKMQNRSVLKGVFSVDCIGLTGPTPRKHTNLFAELYTVM